jgi:hypothetical protein
MRSVQQIAERQALKAQLCERHRAPGVPGKHTTPVITVSREFYAGGEIVGRGVADALGFEYWDHELLARVAQESGALEDILSSLDERVQSPVSDFLESLLVGIEYSQGEYRRILIKVVTEIACRGSAVLVGRASHLILGTEHALRVRVVCPESVRISRLQAEEELTDAEAKQRVRSEDRGLRAFVHHHFKHEIATAEDFDVIVNTGVFTASQARDIVVAAYRTRFPAEDSQQPEPQPEPQLTMGG